VREDSGEWLFAGGAQGKRVGSGEKNEERFFPQKARKEAEVFASKTPLRMTCLVLV